jgi:hypothetical protein
LFNKNDWNFEESQKLPQAVIDVSPEESVVALQGGDEMGIALDKDCREELSFNYQINLLHRASEYGDDFITFPNLFGGKEGALRCCLLDTPQSLFDERLNLSSAEIIADNINYRLVDDSLNSIEIRFETPSGINLDRVRSIVFYEAEMRAGEIIGRYAYLVKNVAPNEAKLRSWWIYPTYNTKTP